MIFGQNKGASSKAEAQATQQFIDVKEIREGVIVLKDSSWRMMLEISSINFALKGIDEQNAIIIQFQEFLNSLDFPIQITINSRKLDINPYLDYLEQLGKQQQNELLKRQTEEYINFIRGMVELQNIMTKNFYLTIPLHRISTKVTSVFSKNKKVESETTGESYQKERNQLLQRADHVIMGIRRIGLKARLLGSEEVLNILLQLYNPTAQMKDINLPSTGLANYS
jgi:hypothetical protein